MDIFVEADMGSERKPLKSMEALGRVELPTNGLGIRKSGIAGVCRSSENASIHAGKTRLSPFLLIRANQCCIHKTRPGLWMFLWILRCRRSHSVYDAKKLAGEYDDLGRLGRLARFSGYMTMCGGVSIHTKRA
ncbi:MAG: hypothetical protein ROO76_23885 [Terriglobia bacterium]|nr:hypothetical protein [Terriglobia bacterium]